MRGIAPLARRSQFLFDADAVRPDGDQEQHLGRTGPGDTQHDDLSAGEVEQLYESGTLEHEAARDLPCHTGLVLTSANGSALGRVRPDKSVQLVRGDREAFGLHGRSAEQRIALDLLMDDEIGIVSLGGRAGTGKSAMALCAGLELVKFPPGKKQTILDEVFRVASI